MRSLAVLKTALLVGSGGFAGANLRYGVGLLVPGHHGTFLANVLGSFLIGLLLYYVIDAGGLSQEARLVATTGFLGSFTTYSTFALEAVRGPEIALAYVVGSYAFGFGGVLAGRCIVHRFRGDGP